MDATRTPDEAAAPPRAREPSGILAVRTQFLRRRKPPGRKLARPSSRALLILFGLVAAGGLFASMHRYFLDRRFETHVEESRAAPFEIKRIRQELVEMQLDEKALGNALDARLKYLESSRKNQFYVSIDRGKRRFSFHFSDKVLRDTPVAIGPEGTFTAGRKTWTFAPLTGAFSVRGKFEQGGWRAPEWAYRMSGQPPPKRLPSVPGGLGRYVIALGNDYVIHSPPPPGSPLKGAKPGSFMVPEADLAAVWPRIAPETRVYVFGAESETKGEKP